MVEISCGRVLVIDDEIDLREILCERLEDLGWHTSQAGDFHAALEALAQHRFDVVFSDLRLPGGDGYRLMEAGLQSPHPSAPAFVIMSGNAESFEHEALRRGASATLAKPFRWQDLDRILERVLSGKASAPRSDGIFKVT